MKQSVTLSPFKDNPTNGQASFLHTTGKGVETVQKSFLSDNAEALTVRPSVTMAHVQSDAGSQKRASSEPAECAPLGIRAHILSKRVGSPCVRPENVTIKFPSKIEIFPEGTRLSAPPRGGRNQHSGKHKRGKIGGWSKSSRRRMRDFLLTHTVPLGWTACAVTYTIPGYSLPLFDVKRLWQNWTVRANRLPLCAIWRIEIQKRGQLHWHLIVGYNGEPMQAQLQLKHSWHKALRSLGEIEYRYIGNPSEPVAVDYVSAKQGLMAWRGAEFHSARVDVFTDEFGPWKRYLQDHATKSKQEQIPENIGRHWGKINRKEFVEVLPSRATALTHKEYSRFLRAYNRLCTPYLKWQGALFGRKKGFKGKRGRYGKTVYFSRPETIERLVDWASGEQSSGTHRECC